MYWHFCSMFWKCLLLVRDVLKLHLNRFFKGRFYIFMHPDWSPFYFGSDSG